MEDHNIEQYTPTSCSFNINDEKYLNQLQRNGLYLKDPESSLLKNTETKSNNTAEEDTYCDKYECNDPLDRYCHVKLDSIIKLKNSTKKLLHLLDEIQSKTHTKNEFLTIEHFITTKPTISSNTDVSDNISISALKHLENQTRNLEDIYPQEEDDDCSVYKRLTRKCYCLNQIYYNDFVIHFNEKTKYSTNNIGEIIKNIRILKKFLYMGGAYTKNALMFLNEGLSDSPQTEKIEIIHGCTHADICNIFEDHSLVIVCILWPCKHYYFGDFVTQALAAGLLHKLAEIEEGRRYLNFSTRIANDIRKVLKKKSTVLDIDTTDSLNATLDLLKPPFSKSLQMTYLNKPIFEGFGYKTVNDLMKFRQYMTLDEVLTHLDLLKHFSNNDPGQVELTTHLPAILILFKNILMEFNNSEINITVSHILNNIVTKNIKANDEEQPKVVSIADTATEPIAMKNEMVQIPPKPKNASKKSHKQKLSLGLAPTKNCQPSVRQVSGWEPSRLLNGSKKFKKDVRRSIIVVPIERNEED